MFDGDEVVAFAEHQAATWEALGDPGFVGEFDVVLWSPSNDPHEERHPAMLRAAERAGVLVVGFHHDLWWGVGREALVWTSPFFRCPVVVTSDGDHDDRWLSAGVNHVWMAPPALSSLREVPEHRYGPSAGKAVFVGSWRNYPHPQWAGPRRELVSSLRAQLGLGFATFPDTGRRVRRRIAGAELSSLLSSAAVVVGDVCFAGVSDRYWSDRVPITAQAGGLLLHPHSPALEAEFGDSILYFEAGDYVQAAELAASAIIAPHLYTKKRESFSQLGLGHTWEARVVQLAALIATIR